MPDQKDSLPAEKLFEQLQQENALLRKLLLEHGIAIPSPESPPERLGYTIRSN
jgi:hypothetical protein